VTPLRLRGYAVERLLGSGSTSEVWQARVVSTGARVALKRIVIGDDEQLRRAQVEAGLLAALDHPNLVRLHTALELDDAVVLVLDLAEAGSLADLLAARGRLAPGEVITALGPIAAAVGYLHDEGVVHGDVSAANILFTAAGTPLLADVGVARLTGAESDAEATPVYVDPIVAGGGAPGTPSDVFMLGGVALHALTGSPPWPADDPALALARAAGGVLDDVGPRLADAGVPEAMAAVVSRALNVHPDRRGTAADLALDLAHSAPPVAIELSAGLVRRASLASLRPGPRHAAAASGREPVAEPSAPGRPGFERPRELAAEPGGPPPTRLVAPRPRPVIPRPRRRRRLPNAVVGVAVGAAVAIALATVGVVWARASDRPTAAPHRVSASVPQRQVETSAGVGGSSSSSPSRVPLPSPAASPVPSPAPADWPAALVALDAVRGRAFGTRDPALLRRVYVAGPLLRRDAALLHRLVPAGCVLTGVRTHYAAIRATAHGNSAVVTALATLQPSRLVCGGRLRDRAPGAGPIRLRVELVRTEGGVRIAALSQP
jgi:eukaryotic-like serine/threonine-protein kinase